ncbi:MAG: hypothetical protein ABI164_06525, partial [Acidobacteriaceae bacterium]
TIGQHGADVVYLGLDGPMSDASNEFHWLLEHARESAQWSAQSYDLQRDSFSHARLAVVYNTHSPEYSRQRSQLELWVREGGKVLFWDPMAHANGDPLLDGIRFTEHASFDPSKSLRFNSGAGPLLAGLSDTTLELNEGLASNIQSASKDWLELAYTVLPSINERQFYRPYPTFGPRWTSLMDPARVPVLLSRKYGKGTVIVAQMGRWTIQPQLDMDQVRVRAVESPIGKFAGNIVRWAATTNQSLAVEIKHPELRNE